MLCYMIADSNQKNRDTIKTRRNNDNLMYCFRVDVNKAKRRMGEVGGACGVNVGDRPKLVGRISHTWRGG